MIRELFVPGLPVTQGSKTPRMREVSGERLRIWREAVGWRVKAAGWHRDLINGPVRLDLRFVLPAFVSAPDRYWAWSQASGDLDKLVRAVGDALTGLAYTDDSRVVQLHASKHHGAEPGVNIIIDPIGDPS
jgi:crossover junction endodeoxyribonuclease RusA